MRPIYLLFTNCDEYPDIIELGIPFSDPVGDGPIIQDAHAVALQNGTSVSTVLEVVQTARTRGLHIPIVLMGYCAPVMHYGAPRFIMEAARAGVDGFLIADLPCKESLGFRELCAKAGYVFYDLMNLWNRTFTKRENPGATLLPS